MFAKLQCHFEKSKKKKKNTPNQTKTNPKSKNPLDHCITLMMTTLLKRQVFHMCFVNQLLIQFKFFCITTIQTHLKTKKSLNTKFKNLY